MFVVDRKELLMMVAMGTAFAAGCLLDREGSYTATSDGGAGGDSMVGPGVGGMAGPGSGGTGGTGAGVSTSVGGSVAGTGGAATGGAPGTGGAGGTIDCGNGSLDASEECDDGNVTPSDGCSATCVVECAGAQTAKHPTTFHCYAYDDSALMTWTVARTLCQNLGAGWDLAVVTSAQERDYLDDTLLLPEGTAFQNDDPFQYWLGGRDFTQTDNFEWFNGEIWSYTPWDTNPQDPSNGNQDCIRLRAISGTSNDVFRDAACTLTSSALCELQPAGT